MFGYEAEVGYWTWWSGSILNHLRAAHRSAGHQDSPTELRRTHVTLDDLGPAGLKRILDEHYHSYGPFMRKRVTLVATLRKVHNMASCAETLCTSAVQKLAEF